MKSGSIRDCADYGWWGECFHPKYHCGPPDGIRDHLSVKHAAIKAANESLLIQGGDCLSRDFKFGYQQAYIDIANGGSGALPAVPPSRYWAAPYRTTWGHNKAREWFTGYEAGATAAQCCMPANTLSVPTSVYRDCDNRLASGLDGGSFGATPIVNANNGGCGSGAAYSPTPMLPNPYSSARYGGAMNAPVMNGPLPLGVSAGASPSPPMMNPPPLTAPHSQGLPGVGWSNGPSPTLPSHSVPSATIPAPDGGGHSISSPGSQLVNPPIAPMSGQRFAPSPTPQRGYSAGNPWGRFNGTSGFGFQPEGVKR
ncbi:MAG: hypothetical protein ACKV2Q_21650 [Planctomycetaceae bacterium]